MKETTEQRNRYQNSLAAQYLGLRAFTGEAWVQFLAREPRFNKLCSRAKKKKTDIITVPWGLQSSKLTDINQTIIKKDRIPNVICMKEKLPVL